MKKIFMAILSAIFLMPSVAWAELLLNENFDYATGNLYQCGAWLKYGTNANSPMQVVNNPLTLAGYQSTAVGKAANVAPGQNSADQDLWIKMSAKDSVNTGAVYASFLCKVINAGSNDGVYFASLVGNKKGGLIDGATSTEAARVFAKNSANSGKFYFGFSKTGTTPQDTSVECTLNETYLVVLKYEFIDGTANDPVAMWVNPSTEADSKINGKTGDGDIAPFVDAAAGTNKNSRGLVGLELRQGGTATKGGPNVIIDAIRMATTWEELFGEGEPSGPSGETPTISSVTVDENDVVFEHGNQHDFTLTVKGANLEGDVNVACKVAHPDITFPNGTTLAKTAVESAEGATIVVRTSGATAGTNSVTIVASNGTASREVDLQWTAYATTNCATISALKLAAGTATAYADLLKYTGSALVTYVNGNKIYAEDATGAICLTNKYEVSMPLAIGDQISNFIINKGETNRDMIPVFAIEAVSHNNAVTPTVVTLNDIANALVDTYLYKLVTFQSVSFSEGTFTTLNATFIDSEGNKGNYKPTGLSGVEKPAYANITGIWHNGTMGTYYLLGRSAADLEEATPSAIELSDNSTIEDWNAINGMTKNVTITRNFVGGVYNTMCFPFALSDGELNALFGAGREVRSLTGSEMENETLILKFSANVSGTYAGRPYIVKPVTDITEPWTKYDAAINTTLNNATTSLVTFMGTIVPTELVASRNTLFLGAGNELFYVSEAAEIKGLRAYFQITESGAVGAPARIRLQNNTTTGVEDILDTDKAHKLMQEGRVIIRMDGHDYDLNGNMIR